MLRARALRPLQTFPSVEAGRARLAGSWCAIAGDPQVGALADQLELIAVEIDDGDRVRYHAAACIASNHLVALLDQVRRVAPIPLEAFLPLVGATVENVSAMGPAAAPPDRDAYRELARLAQRLSGRQDAALDAVLR